MNEKPNILLIAKNRDDVTWFSLWKDDFKKYANITFCGKNYPDCKELSEIIEEDEIDFLLVCGLPVQKYVNEKFDNLNIFKVIILFDFSIYLPDNTHYFDYDLFLKRNKFDLMFAQNKIVKQELSPFFNVEQTYFSFPTSIFDGSNYEKSLDVMSSSGTNPIFYGRRRKELNKFLWTIGLTKVVTRATKFEPYVENIKRAKIFVSSGNILATDCVTIKYMEAIASGTLFMTELPKDLDEYGFEDGKHLVIYSDFNDLKDKIYYYLEHEDERMKIVETAKDFVFKNYTNDIIIQRVLDTIIRSQNSFIRCGSY